MNYERAIVGLAVPFGRPGRNSGRVFSPGDFDDFLASGHGVPIWRDHREPLGADEQLGTWRLFELVPESQSTPAGILSLGELDHTRLADHMLAEISRTLDPYAMGPAPWSLSIGGYEWRSDQVWISEVSLIKETSSRQAPVYDLARVLSVGPGAAAVWELLTGTEAPALSAVTPRTLRRRLWGATTTGRPLFWDED